MAVYMHK